MALVAVGTVLLSGVLDVVLLKLQAGGELLSLSIAFVLAIGSVAMAWVIKRHQAADQRRKREEMLLR
jgi:hypothetical protein